MKKNLIEVVFILDRSGSMCGLETDTIGGFNGMLRKMKKQEGEALVSTVLFDDESEVIHDRVDIRKVPELTEKEYYVRGCTALLDAVGGAIHHIGTIHKYARNEDIPEHTLFVITTDGMENASRFGICPDHAVNYNCDEEGIALNYEVVTEAVGHIRAGKALSGHWKDRIEEDYEKRSHQVDRRRVSHERT